MPDELVKPARQSLFQINQELAELLALRSEMLSADPPEDVSAVDAQMIAFFQREVAKADNIIPFWRHLETTAAVARAEADRLKAYATDLEGQLEHLKLRVKEVMIQFDKKAIPGTVGKLMLKGNGGSAPIQIQEDMLPDELCKWEGVIYGTAWKLIPASFRERADVRMKRVPSNTAVRAALVKPCEHCMGEGSTDIEATIPCPHCGGDKRSRISGARLLERGQHVECK